MHQQRTALYLLLSLCAASSCKGDPTPTETTPTQVVPRADTTAAATPTGQEVETPVDATLRLEFSPDGALSINGQSIENNALVPRLQTERTANPSLEVLIVVPNSILHGQVIDLMDKVKAADISKIAIAATKPSPLPRPIAPDYTADHDGLIRGLPQTLIHSRYGPPAETTRFMASQGAGEMRVEILNDYPSSDPQSAKTEILEETWHGEGFHFVVFSHKIKGEWVGLQSLSYDDGVEF